MDLSIDLRETVSGGIEVTETYGYHDEDAYKASVSISILFDGYDDLTKPLTFSGAQHTSYGQKVVTTLKPKKDGFYTVFHVIIQSLGSINPNKPPRGVYVSDGEKIYYYDDQSKQTVVTLQEWFADPLGFLNTERTKSTFFTMYNLWQCYFNYCRRLLERCADRCDTCGDMYNMNLLWILMNALQFYVEQSDVTKAKELLSMLTGCNSLCTNEMFSRDYDCGCGT